MSDRKLGSRWDQDIEVQGGIGDSILGRDEGDVCGAQGRRFLVEHTPDPPSDSHDFSL